MKTIIEKIINPADRYTYKIAIPKGFNFHCYKQIGGSGEDIIIEILVKTPIFLDNPEKILIVFKEK